MFAVSGLQTGAKSPGAETVFQCLRRFPGFAPVSTLAVFGPCPYPPSVPVPIPPHCGDIYHGIDIH